MGRNHARVLSLLKSAEIRFVYDTDPETAASVALLIGAEVASDLNQASSEVDAVVVATPTTTHAAYVHQLAPKVRNLFIEKPLTDSAASARELAEVAALNELNVQIGFIERFNPAVQQLKRVLDRSNSVVCLDFTRTNKISERITDVDVITDLMVHDLDLALYLNGPVRNVSAHGVATADMVEFASAVLVHENGRQSRVLASRITEKKMRLIQATCSDMFVDCDLLRKEIVISRQSMVIQPEGEPYTITAREETLEVPPHETLMLEMQAFLDSCNGRSTPGIPDVAAGVEVLEICDEIQDQIHKLGLQRK